MCNKKINLQVFTCNRKLSYNMNLDCLWKYYLQNEIKQKTFASTKYSVQSNPTILKLWTWTSKSRIERILHIYFWMDEQNVIFIWVGQWSCSEWEYYLTCVEGGISNINSKIIGTYSTNSSGATRLHKSGYSLSRGFLL